MSYIGLHPYQINILLFSIYVNSLPECIPEGIIDMYADDTTLTVSANDATVLEEKLTVALNRVMAWIRENRLVLNTDKTFCHDNRLSCKSQEN